MEKDDKNFTREQEQVLDESTRQMLGQQQASPEDEDGLGWGVQIFKMISYISLDVGFMDSSARSPSDIEGFLVERVDSGFLKNYVSHTFRSALGAPDTIGMEIDNQTLCEDLTRMAKEFCISEA